MTNMATFERQMDRAFREAVIKPVVKLHKMTVVLVYDAIIDNSAIFSGYYMSNHRIGIPVLADALLDPKERPDDVLPFAFIDNVLRARNSELNKLDALRDRGIGDFTTVVIGTAVPYAEELEARDGTYNKAAAEGSAEAAGNQLLGEL